MSRLDEHKLSVLKIQFPLLASVQVSHPFGAQGNVTVGLAGNTEVACLTYSVVQRNLVVESRGFNICPNQQCPASR